MMTAIRLLLLLALSLQTIASSWATCGRIQRLSPPLPTALKAYTDVATSESAWTKYMDPKEHSMDSPCDLADNEKWDTASDEGLRETLHFNVILEGDKNRLPHSEQRYNFFIRYGIPPPELL